MNIFFQSVACLCGGWGFAFVFSSLTLWLQEIRVSSRALMKADISFMRYLSWEFQFLSSFFSFSILSSAWGAISQSSCICYLAKMFESIIYTVTHILSSFKCLQWWHLGYIHSQFTAWTIRALFTTGNIVHSTFKSDQIQEPIPETSPQPRPVQKTQP